MDKVARESLLYDFYGALLTDKKRRVMELYHEDDLSLSEIAEEMGVSRAAVHDALRSAERKLESYEEKLGLVARYGRMEELKARSENADREELLSIIDEMAEL